MSFRNALRLDPNPVLKGEILYNLGMVLKSKGDFPEAVKVFCLVLLISIQIVFDQVYII